MIRRYVTEDLEGAADVFCSAFAEEPWNEKWDIELAKKRISELMSSPQSVGYIYIDGEAIRAILSAGGIPVYAHPIGGEREKRLTMSELEGRVDALIKLGLGGLECYYSRYSGEDEALLISFAKSRGLYVSAGSDYHGRNKTVELSRLCSDADTDAPEATVIGALLGD